MARLKLLIAVLVFGSLGIGSLAFMAPNRSATLSAEDAFAAYDAAQAERLAAGQPPASGDGTPQGFFPLLFSTLRSMVTQHEQTILSEAKTKAPSPVFRKSSEGRNLGRLGSHFRKAPGR